MIWLSPQNNEVVGRMNAKEVFDLLLMELGETENRDRIYRQDEF